MATVTITPRAPGGIPFTVDLPPYPVLGGDEHSGMVLAVRQWLARSFGVSYIGTAREVTDAGVRICLESGLANGPLLIAEWRP